MKDFDHEIPLRPNFEFRQAIGWLGSTGLTLGMMPVFDMPHTNFLTMAGLQACAGLYRARQAWSHHRKLADLADTSLDFIDIDRLESLVSDEGRYIGRGYVFTQKHTQLVNDIKNTDLLKHIPKRKIRKKSIDHGDEISSAWIHAIERKILDRYLSMSQAAGHILLLGTTGSGKTRLLEMQVAQDIMRKNARGDHSPVIIIDPKGDKDLVKTIQRACARAGREKDFRYFHPAHPERSVRIDMLRNFSTPAELASRIAALIDSGGNTSFKDFCHMALNNIIQAIVLTSEVVTLKKILRFLEGEELAGITKKCMEIYITKHRPDAMITLKTQVVKAKRLDQKIEILWEWYALNLRDSVPSTALEQLMKQYRHDQNHFNKMISSLLPLLTTLTADHVGMLLSPQYDQIDDQREVLSTDTVVQNNLVLYVGLRTLVDNTVGHAIGSLLLSDMAAVAGALYDYEDDPELIPKYVYVDETAELINKPLLMMLNKSRGAGFQFTVATQTIADLVAGYGNQAEADQFLGNLNNTYCLRIVNTDTKDFVISKLPEVKIKYRMLTQGNSSEASTVEFGGNTGERLMEEQVPLIPADVLGSLPNLHYFCINAEGMVIKAKVPIVNWN
jgi:conjugal transfer pilus assembly protein TraD